MSDYPSQTKELHEKRKNKDAGNKDKESQFHEKKLKQNLFSRLQFSSLQAILSFIRLLERTQEKEKKLNNKDEYLLNFNVTVRK